MRRKKLSFKEARTQARWTPTSLAAELGISRQTIINYDEADWGIIQADTIAKCTTLFGVKVTIEKGKIVADSVANI